METIKEIRQRTGLSRQKFCEPLNIPVGTLRNWEQGIRECPPYLVELIAFRVDHDPVFRKQNKNKPE